MAEKVGGVFYEVDLDTSKMIRSQREVDRRLDDMGKSGDRLQTKFTAVAAGITAAIAAIGVEALASKLVTAQRNFDVLFSSLKTVTGGVDAAGAAFERLRLFAAQTPYTLDQAVNGFVKLKALGLDPSERAMTSFGNTASAMGKSLSQMIEAVADASTGEFERLKEFGIKAKTEGDKIIFTFRGVSTEVQNSSNKITEYLTKIGETDFAGAMSERMKTLDGDLSNLEDAWSAFVLTVSQSGLGDQIAASVRMASEAIQEMTVSVKQGGLTDYFSTLQAIMPVLEVAVVSLAGAMAGRMVAALAAAATQAYATATAMGAATVAARGFGAALTLMGGPIGIAITALALIALNWDKISNRAKSAAEVSEDAANRIAKALQRAAGQQTAALKGTKAELQTELGKARQGLTNLKVGTYGKGTPQQIAEAEARVVALQEAITKIDTILGGNSAAGAGRGSVNPDFTPGPTTLENWTPPKSAASGGGKSGAKTSGGDTGPTGDPLGSFITDQLNRANERDAQAAQDLIQQRAADQAMAMEILLGNDAIARLEYQLQQKSDKLKEAAERDAANADLYAAAQVALETDTLNKIKQIRDESRTKEQQAQAQQLQGYGQLFDGMAGVVESFAGKQNAAYKVLFAASKAFAVAESIIKIQQGIANASALPFPANLGAMAAVAAQTAGIVSTIKGTSYGGGRQYGGPVQAGMMYKVNETGAPEMFQGANGSQYMMPNKSGQVVPANQLGGRSAPNIVVNNNAGSVATARASYDSRTDTTTITVSEVANQIRSRSGPIWNALKTTNVQGRLD